MILTVVPRIATLLVFGVKTTTMLIFGVKTMKVLTIKINLKFYKVINLKSSYILILTNCNCERSKNTSVSKFS